MNVERAQTLSHFLRTEVQRRHFDMGMWHQERQARWPFDRGCGTACCAGGWACLIPEFQRDGLALQSGGIHRIPVLRLSGEKVGLLGYEALAIFFNISLAMSRRWFDPATYFSATSDITPAIVADRIDADIAWYGERQADESRKEAAVAIEKAQTTAISMM